MLRKRHFSLILLILYVLMYEFSYAPGAGAQNRGAASVDKVPSPESSLGFKIGEDRKLAKWAQFLSYFGELAKTSDRIKLDTLGKTTLGRPFVVATISSPE